MKREGPTLHHLWEKPQTVVTKKRRNILWNRILTERNLCLDRAGFSARRTRFCQLPVKALLRHRDASSAAKLLEFETPWGQNPLEWVGNDRYAFLSRDGNRRRTLARSAHYGRRPARIKQVRHFATVFETVTRALLHGVDFCRISAAPENETSATKGVDSAYFYLWLPGRRNGYSFRERFSECSVPGELPVERI